MYDIHITCMGACIMLQIRSKGGYTRFCFLPKNDYLPEKCFAYKKRIRWNLGFGIYNTREADIASAKRSCNWSFGQGNYCGCLSTYTNCKNILTAFVAGLHTHTDKHTGSYTHKRTRGHTDNQALHKKYPIDYRIKNFPSKTIEKMCK